MVSLNGSKYPHNVVPNIEIYTQIKCTGSPNFFNAFAIHFPCISFKDRVIWPVSFHWPVSLSEQFKSQELQTDQPKTLQHVKANAIKLVSIFGERICRSHWVTSLEIWARSLFLSVYPKEATPFPSLSSTPFPLSPSLACSSFWLLSRALIFFRARAPRKLYKSEFYAGGNSIFTVAGAITPFRWHVSNESLYLFSGYVLLLVINFSLCLIFVAHLTLTPFSYGSIYPVIPPPSPPLSSITPFPSTTTWSQ